MSHSGSADSSVADSQAIIEGQSLERITEIVMTKYICQQHRARSACTERHTSGVVNIIVLHLSISNSDFENKKEFGFILKTNPYTKILIRL